MNIFYIGQEVRILYGFGVVSMFGIIIDSPKKDKILRILYYNVALNIFVILRVSSHFVVADIHL